MPTLPTLKQHHKVRGRFVLLPNEIGKEARFDVKSVMQARMVLWAFSHIKTSSSPVISVSFEDFCRETRMEAWTKNRHDDNISKMVRDLIHCTFTVKDKFSKDVWYYALIQYACVSESKKQVTIEINHRAWHYIRNMTKSYCQIYLQDVVPLSTLRALRLMMLLSHQRNIASPVLRTYPVEDLRYTLNMEDPTYNNSGALVRELSRTLKEVEEKTSNRYVIVPKKEGRRIEAIRFDQGKVQRVCSANHSEK